MTTDSEGLEEAFRENLKLRDQLAGEVAKAKGESQRGGVYRLGWVLYWISLPLALAVGLYLMLPMAGFGILGLIPIWMAALAVYGLGRAFRYVLSGE